MKVEAIGLLTKSAIRGIENKDEKEERLKNLIRPTVQNILVKFMSGEGLVGRERQIS